MKFYAGVGSRETPDDVLAVMEKVAKRLSDLGWICRTGGAHGADKAFLEGAAKGETSYRLYLPWPGFSGFAVARRTRPEGWTYKVASEVHPAWDRLSGGAPALHARNVHQVLGDSGEMTHSSFVVCWTPGAALKGGTATAIRLAEQYEIPVFNLALPDVRARVEAIIR